VLGPHNLVRREAERQDRLFDARHPIDFPHFFPASAVHRLRSALRRGSLILAADLPEPGDGVAVPFLGGRALVDLRPFRLARAARVPCRPAFLTLPRGRWTLTLGRVLPREEAAAVAAFASCLAEVAARSPLDLDGPVYSRRAREG
jgi:lauroyl/myristoyl acyltransferase